MYKIAVAFACIVVACCRRIESSGERNVTRQSNRRSRSLLEKHQSNALSSLLYATFATNVISHRSSGPSMEAAVIERPLELEYAPPSPPPPNTGGGGGGGDGDGDGGASAFLKMVEKADRQRVLSDWMHQCQIYSMDTMFGSSAFAEKHSKMQETLREIQQFVTDAAAGVVPDHKVLLGLYDENHKFEKLRVMASAELKSKDGVLVVTRVVVHPSEIGKESSVASLDWMLHALDLLADSIETELDLSIGAANDLADLSSDKSDSL